MSARAGFFIVDKPVGLTSHDVVSILRAITGIKKIGHTGTLDPFATGVLPLAIGRCTRLIQFLDEDLKIYDATIALRVSTDTGDPTGTVEEERAVPSISEEQIAEVLSGFRGVRMQRPPRYSAVKVKGKALYKYAREGKIVEAEPRPIRIDRIDMVSHEGTELRVRIQCGRGTYARVLANEIAEELGTVGHLSALRREQSGIFTEARAVSVQQIAQIVAGRDDWQHVLRPERGAERVPWAPRDEVWRALQQFLFSPEQVLTHLPSVCLSASQRDRLVRGGIAPPAPSEVAVGSHFLAMGQDKAVAVIRREESGSKVARFISQS